MDWTTRPVTAIPVRMLVWPCHDIDAGHVHPQLGTVTSTGPIHVEQLIDGHLFIHDGRHRALRASLNGEATIPARVLRH